MGQNAGIKCITPKRDQHRQEVIAFLQRRLTGRRWELTLPSSGRGQETYIAQSNGERYFVKLGAQVMRYQIMASLDLTPAIIVSGFLPDGLSILVQSHIRGRNPTWRDFRRYWRRITTVVDKTHHNLALKSILTAASSETYQDVGAAAVNRLQQKWRQYRLLVPTVTDYVDETLANLEQATQKFAGSDLVASHNDMCNGNWLIAADEKIYLVDLEMMSQDDPAHDMGSLLWWYYPPALRQGFLERAGYQYDEAFKNRMRVRMALHCLNILLPRAESFDRFDADLFAERLMDFRAVVAGQENPRGYDD